MSAQPAGAMPPGAALHLEPAADSGTLAAAPVAGSMQRPTVRGKFLFAGDEKLWVRGVTYGTFRPDAAGHLVPPPEVVRADFAEMARNGINAVRTYTLPPRWLLDLAQEAGLRVMVGLWWEQFVTFLDSRGRRCAIEQKVREGVRSLAGHPALLCYAIGNEISPSIVRWHGRRRIEKFIHRLVKAVKAVDPTALVTYVNYPTTEYLQLPWLDLVCFNVYLESREKLEAYLARLQNLADERPLLMAEIGLDSRRHGEARQSEVMRWQVQSAWDAGCCGMFAFAWTDEWFCGGYDITDWDFGLVRRDRTPKPALAAVRDAYAGAPFDSRGAAVTRGSWPRISVVVCSYNGSRTIRDTMEGLQRVDYPNFEVIVVNDGSTDRTPEIVSEYPVRLISTENRGLSSARNTGCDAATGEIIAYIDDDAYPDPHWLRYLALEYLRSVVVGVGGPNLPPPGDGSIADCVANSPGGPVHVLLTDRVAEHIPGCNMSFRRSALVAVGGFDPVYRAAGDDVDLCWRLQEKGGVIGFAPAAVVWHHRRNSVRTYWKQQRGYGKAEALLERKWPERYNAAGHLSWKGRLYGRGWTLSLASLGGRIYRGMWNTAPFQSLYERGPGTLLALPLMPEWYLVVGALAGLVLLGIGWRPLLFALPFLAVATAAPIAQALLSAGRARFTSAHSRADRVRLFVLTAYLHLMQPMARLVGRIDHGLVPWRHRGPKGELWRTHVDRAAWRETWKAPDARLAAMHGALQRAGAVTCRGGDWEDWDLAVRGGILGGARLRLAVEEHGAGKQMLRFRFWARVPAGVIALVAGLGGLGTCALAGGAGPVGRVLLCTAFGVLGLAAADAARALAALDAALPAAEQEAASDA
jgi:glycosyltransferase involved in cell wall biosynthesis